MKAFMSEKLREILNNRAEAKQLWQALHKLHNSGKEELEVEIGEKIYTIKYVRRVA